MLTFMNSKLPHVWEISDKLYLVIISAIELKFNKQKKPFAIQKPKTFEFFPKSFAPFNQIIFDQSSPCVLLIDKPSENCKNSKTFERNTLST